MKRRAFCLLAGLLLPLAACGDDDGGNGNQNNQGLDCPRNFEVSPSGKACVYGTLSETERTQCGDVWEDCDETGTLTPDLSCLDQTVEPPANPPLVTMTGYVDVFSSGGDDVDGVRVQVFRQSDVTANASLDSLTPVAETTLSIDQSMVDSGQVRACLKNNDDVANLQVECPVPTDDCDPPCQDTLDGNEFCYQGQCYERLRYEVRYSLENVPTYEFLVVRTIGPQGVSDSNWAPIVQYNVYLRTTDAAYDESTNTYETEVNLISRQDWFQIPQVMGLSNGVAPGKGVIAGEVHDCQGLRLTGAQVGLYPMTDYFSYFNGNPVSTLPNMSQLQRGTNRLSLYAAMNLDPGPLRVEAWGLVGGEPTLLGHHTVQIFPDSVTIVSINDGMPPMPE